MTTFRRFHTWLQRIGDQNRLAIHRFYPRSGEAPDYGSSPRKRPRHWAQVLEALPGLRHLLFVGEETCCCTGEDPLRYLFCNDCEEPDGALGPERLELGQAIRALPNLLSWSGVEVSLCMAPFGAAAPTLKALQLHTIGAPEGTHLPNYFFRCPSLQYLQIGYFPIIRMAREYALSDQENYDPPLALQPKHLYNVPDGAFDYTDLHASGVHIFILPSYGRQPVWNIDYSPLVSQCPNLTYLGLECGGKWRQLDQFPDSLQTLALVFDYYVDMQELASRLLALKARCHSLGVVAIFMCWDEDCNWSDEIMATLGPLLGALQQLKDEGVHVAFWLEVTDMPPESLSESEDSDDDRPDPITRYQMDMDALYAHRECNSNHDDASEHESDSDDLLADSSEESSDESSEDQSDEEDLDTDADGGAVNDVSRRQRNSENHEAGTGGNTIGNSSIQQRGMENLDPDASGNIVGNSSNQLRETNNLNGDSGARAPDDSSEWETDAGDSDEDSDEDSDADLDHGAHSRQSDGNCTNQ